MIKFVPYINKSTDYKQICIRCGYNDHAWNINGDFVCKHCLTKEEMLEIIVDIEEQLL